MSLTSAVWCCDIEATGLLEDLRKQEKPKMHNFCGINSKTGEKVLFSRSKITGFDGLQEWLRGKTLVMHNGITYDGEAMSFFGIDMSETEIVDTLALSWYLYPKRVKHGLEAWGEDFGIPKPPITDWINEHPAIYDNRVEQDCRIQVKIWRKIQEDLKDLYGSLEGREHIVQYTNFKMELQRLQAKNRWTLDKKLATDTLASVEKQIEEKTLELEAAMPDVVVYSKKTRPAKPFLKSGALSKTGLAWDALTKEHGHPFDYTGEIKVKSGTNPANAGSHQQIKKWLFDMGWQPETFKYVRNKDTGETRAIPQITVPNSGGKLCPSLERLHKENPNEGVEHLQGLGLLGHRKGLLSGFLRNVLDDGTIVAECAGFTNTLRLKHSVLVNLPSTRVHLGEQIRACLTTERGFKNIGSDLSSLEDRCKHHFQWKFDKEFVKKQMVKGFDPHLTVCVIAGIMSQKDMDWFIDFKSKGGHGTPEEEKRYNLLGETRHIGKGGNYACQYGAGVEALMRQLDIDKETATKLHKGYWEMNKSIKQIANSTTVKNCLGVMWQWNPVSKIWYWLKAMKDRFSTLCQGLGSYIFDMWSLKTLDVIRERWGKEAPYVAQFHDELVLLVKEGTLDIWTDVLKTAIKRVDDELKLNRSLDCDVDIGDNYSEIH